MVEAMPLQPWPNDNGQGWLTAGLLDKRRPHLVGLYVDGLVLDVEIESKYKGFGVFEGECDQFRR